MLYNILKIALVTLVCVGLSLTVVGAFQVPMVLEAAFGDE